MATKRVALLAQVFRGIRIAGPACALAVLFASVGCDDTMMIDNSLDEGGAAGTRAPNQGIGGMGGGGTAPIATGGTEAPTATGGVGGQGQTSPVPGGCAPISTTPSVVNPCGHAFGLAVSPDGQLLSVGMDSQSPSVRVWRLTDGMPLPDLPGQTSGDTTYKVAFSPDGKLLAAAGTTSSTSGRVPWVRFWDVATAKLIRALQPDSSDYVSALAFSSNGSLIVTGGMLGPAEVWRVADGGLVHAFDVPNSTHNAHFSPDDSKLIVATANGEARVFDIASGALVLGPLATAQEMSDAQMSPDGTQLATTWQSGNEQNSVRIYDATSGKLLQSLGGHLAYISETLWIDQNRIVSDDWSGMIMLWQRNASGSFQLAKSWSTGGQSMQMGVSPDKTTIVAGGADGGQGFVFLRL